MRLQPASNGNGVSAAYIRLAYYDFVLSRLIQRGCCYDSCPQ